MLAEKHQLEGQLLRTAGEVALAERELSRAGSRRTSPAASADGGTIEAYMGAAATQKRPRVLGYRMPLRENDDEDDSDDSDFEEVRRPLLPEGVTGSSSFVRCTSWDEKMCNKGLVRL